MCFIRARCCRSKPANATAGHRVLPPARSTRRSSAVCILSFALAVSDPERALCCVSVVLEPSPSGGRQMAMRWFLFPMLAISLAACSHSSGRANGASPSTTTTARRPSTPRPTVTSHLQVASRTIEAGSAVRVTVVIENHTGRPIGQPACHTSTQWQAYLINGRDASGPLPTATALRCDPNMPADSLPVGETRVSFTTHATYFSCASAADSDPPTPRCLPGGSMPPLPPGTYRIEVDASPYAGVPRPAALATVVVA